MDPFNTIDEASESPFAQAEEVSSVQDSDESVVEEASAELETQEPDAPKTEAPISKEAQEEKSTDESEQEPEKSEEQSLEDAEKEIESRLADPKSPRWFKNAVENVYKPKLEAFSKQLETYEQFGKPEEITQKLDLLSKLETVRSNPMTGLPERTTEDFVKHIHEQNPQTAYQLINDLSHLPSPNTQGLTVLQEMFKQVGIDPTRLEEVKTFAANGYQLSQGQYPPPDADDLALVPQHLQATFSALSPERRDDLLASSEHVRNEALEDAKLARDAKQREELATQTSEQKAAQEEVERQNAIKQAVDVKADEHFSKTSETVFTNFVESLAKQAGMTNMDSLMIANTVLNSFEPTLAGKQSQEMLKAEGIEIDPVIQTTIGQMQENARHIAYYDVMQDRSAYEKAVAKQVELQERLTAKGNKIIASLALKKANGVQNTADLKVPTSRHAVAGVGASINSNKTSPSDFSDEAYLAKLRATGFGSTRS